jgi:uncharacterized membrane protein YoaK (UPF0700 family)
VLGLLGSHADYTMSETTPPVPTPRSLDAGAATSLPIVLAFTSGYVDTLGFVALFGLFTAHVTGNFVLIGSELAGPTHGVMIKLLALPAFVAAVIGARLAVLVAQRAGRDAGPLLLGVQAVLLAAFMTAGWAALPLDNPDAPMALAAGSLGAAAMGIQNAAGRLVWSALTPTTVMTGNVTQLVIDLVDLLRGGREAGLAQRARRFLWPVIAFAVGAVSGAFAYRDVAFLALALPVVLLLTLMWQSGKGR